MKWEFLEKCVMDYAFSRNLLLGERSKLVEVSIFPSNIWLFFLFSAEEKMMGYSLVSRGGQ